MDQERQFDAVIVGAGQAGVPLAKSLAQAGWRTALVESTHVGGTCVNEGCTPTKTMIASARVAYLAGRASDYGVICGDVSVDMGAVRERTSGLVRGWRESSRRRLESVDNLDLLLGEARFAGPHALEVRSEDEEPVRLEAARVFVNTGCRPAIPPLSGLEDVPYLTSTTILELDSLPQHLLILGGGYVAVEFAQMFRRFGSRVTLIQRRATLLPREDIDIAEGMAGILREDGVQLVLGADARSVSRTPDGEIRLEVQTGDTTITLAGSHLLVATGRVPNTEALDLRAAGLDPDAGGYLPVNDKLETRVEGIYALGDVNGGPAFTHISYDDFRVIRTNLLGEGGGTTRDRIVPYVIFTDPELGRVGLGEREARARGFDVRVYTMPMTHVARALETDEARDLMKVVVDGKQDRILGCAILGVEGGEIMSLVQLAMMGGLTGAQLRDTVFAHPTIAESFNNLFSQ
jgi:pyruvate/2-oxoglutarate dehydrogenase complex dihydrolipoamide dehydrogenase (E3) component